MPDPPVYLLQPVQRKPPWGLLASVALLSMLIGATVYLSTHWPL